MLAAAALRRPLTLARSAACAPLRAQQLQRRSIIILTDTKVRGPQWRSY